MTTFSFAFYEVFLSTNVVVEGGGDKEKVITKFAEV
jgi:hypothetical protein